MHAMSHSLKIAVLMGGPSEEHDISLKSGHGVVEALIRRHWTVHPVVLPKALTLDEARTFAGQALQDAGVDVAFIALHGAFGEDGTIQEVCEELHLAYTGSTAATSRMGMDKAASKKQFEEVGLCTPRWQVLDLSKRPLRLGRYAYPLVVKPTQQGSSLGVSIVHQEAQLRAALTMAGRYGPRVLIEEFIAGSELTVGVFGDEPLPVVEVRPSRPFFDYTAKYTAGLTNYLVPAPLDPDVAAAVQDAGLRAHRALGCRHLSRTDLILGADRVPIVLEVNTIPGFTPTSLLPKAAACVNLSYDELCERLVLMAWQDVPQVTGQHR